jgi:hypothetical protein
MRMPYWVVTRAELLEVSAVPVPSDPDALAVERAIETARAKGIDVKSVQEAWDHLSTTGVESDFLKSAGLEFFRGLAEHRLVVPVSWLGGIAFERDVREPVPEVVAPVAAEPAADPDHLPDELGPVKEVGEVATEAVVEKEAAAATEPDDLIDSLLHDLAVSGQTTGEVDGTEADIERFIDDLMGDTRAPTPAATPTQPDSDESDLALIRSTLPGLIRDEVRALLKKE